jgi:hypothetical protein
MGRRPTVYNDRFDDDFEDLKRTTLWEYKPHQAASHLNVLPDGTTMEMANLVAEGELDQFERKRETNSLRTIE